MEKAQEVATAEVSEQELNGEQVGVWQKAASGIAFPPQKVVLSVTWVMRSEEVLVASHDWVHPS